MDIGTGAWPATAGMSSQTAFGNYNVKSALQQTLSPSTRHQGEQVLGELEHEALAGRIPLATLLLDVVADQTIDNSVRLAASLFLKNFVSRSWSLISGQFPSEGQVARGRLVAVLMSSPVIVQRQLVQVLVSIASVDFPEQWPTLVNDLFSYLSGENLSASVVVLRALHRLFKRYRTAFRSDELYTEINFVLDQMASSLLSLYQTIVPMVVDYLSQTSAAAAATSGGGTGHVIPEHMAPMMRMAIYVHKIIYSLCSQDLPTFFEENLHTLMSLLLTVLSSPLPSLNAASAGEEEDEDDAQPGVPEKMLKTVSDLVVLFASRYEEDFEQLPQFVQASWKLLTTLSISTRYDSLCAVCMQLLSLVAQRERHRVLFEGTVSEDSQQSILALMVERIILPNMCLRASDVSMIEDEPMDYVRREVDLTCLAVRTVQSIGGGAAAAVILTRRDGAIALVRGLLVFQQSALCQIIMQLIDQVCSSDQSTLTPARNLPKDTAVALFAAIAPCQSAETIDRFFCTHLLADLASLSTNSDMAVLNSLRFVADFGGQLSLSTTRTILCTHLTAYFERPCPLMQGSALAIDAFAAIAVDRLLSQIVPLVSMHASSDWSSKAASIAPSTASLVQSLSQRLATASMSNEYLARSMMRLLLSIQTMSLSSAMSSTIHAARQQWQGSVSSALMQAVQRMVDGALTSASSPIFVHYLYESMAALIGSSDQSLNAAMFEFCSSLVSTCSAGMSAVSNESSILATEHFAYAVQLVAVMLEAQYTLSSPNDASVSMALQILPVLLEPRWWVYSESDSSLSTSLMRCILACICVAGMGSATASSGSCRLDEDSLRKLFALYQRLAQNKSTDALAMSLLASIVYYVRPVSHLSMLPTAMLTLLNRMQVAGKTTRVSHAVFLSLSGMLLSLFEQGEVSQLVHLLDNIQPNLLHMLLMSLLPQVHKIRERHDRRLAIAGMIIFASHPMVLDYQQADARLLEMLFSSLASMTIGAQSTGGALLASLGEGVLFVEDPVDMAVSAVGSSTSSSFSGRLRSVPMHRLAMKQLNSMDLMVFLKQQFSAITADRVAVLQTKLSVETMSSLQSLLSN